MCLDGTPHCPYIPLPLQTCLKPGRAGLLAPSCACTLENVCMFIMKVCRLVTDLSPLHEQVMDQPAQVVVRQKHVAADLLVRLPCTQRTRQRTGFSHAHNAGVRVVM